MELSVIMEVPLKVPTKINFGYLLDRVFCNRGASFEIPFELGDFVLKFHSKLVFCKHFRGAVRNTRFFVAISFKIDDLRSNSDSSWMERSEITEFPLNCSTKLYI